MTVRSTRRVLLGALLSTMLVGSACSDPGVVAPAGAAAARTALPRDLTPAERSVLSASNAFSLALWQRINATQRDSNVFVSPLSASFSLGMALNGAAGSTFDELRAGLQLGTLSTADIGTGYKSLIALLTSLDPGTTMAIANSIWYRNTFTFNQSFLDEDASYFDATIRPLDFGDVSGAVSAINGWVSNQTHGKIPTIVRTIEPENVMFLINAIYFKGSWRTRFDPALTQDAPFHASGGDQPARLMHRQGRIAYASAPSYQAVDLPYGDSTFMMTVLLPAAGTTVETLADSLSGRTWQTLLDGLRPGEVDLLIPKLTLSWTRNLIPDLQALGVRVPFTDAADFTRMSPDGKKLSLSSVQQKTFVDIDEDGTEAAAVTSTGISATSAVVPVVVRVDRPFVFVIRERLTGTMLFMGKVTRLP